MEEVLAIDPGYIKWMAENVGRVKFSSTVLALLCLLYTSDAADDLLCVVPGGRRIITKIYTTQPI